MTEPSYTAAFYKSLVVHSLDMIVITNTEGVIQYVSQSVVSILGYSPEEMIGKRFLELVHPEDLPTAIINAAAIRAQKDRIKITPYRYKAKDGRWIWAEAVSSNRLDDPNVKGIVTIIFDITERVEADKIIKEQAERLTNIFESITQPFFVLDKEWRYSYVNQIFATSLGKEREYFTGKVIWEVFPEAVGSLFYKSCYEVARTKQTAHFDEYIPNFDTTLNYYIYPSPDGLTVFFTDVTKEKKAEYEIKKLSLVASKTHNGVVILNAEGDAEWVNEGFCKLTGYSPEDIIGHNPAKVLCGPDTNSDTLARLLKSIENGSEFSGEMLRYRKNGEKVWFSIDISPVFDEQGKLVHFVRVDKDINELKLKEEEMAKLAADLAAQNRDLQQFAYIVSHNMRAPVANIMGLAGLLRSEDNNSPQFSEALNLLGTATDQLDTVIKDLSEILSIRSNKNMGKRETVTLAQVIDDVIESLKERIEAAGGTVENRVSKKLKLRAVKAYVYSIFHNLLSNAIKYRAPERPLLITVSCRKKGRDLIVQFADNGLGMNLEKNRKHIFGLYKRFHNHVDGRGLGLYMVREQAEAMGWQIRVDSSLGKGTTFSLYINTENIS